MKEHEFVLWLKSEWLPQIEKDIAYYEKVLSMRRMELKACKDLLNIIKDVSK